MATEASRQRIGVALWRALIYELFAHAFAYPDPERVDALRTTSGAVLELKLPVPLLRLAVLARQAESVVLEPVYVEVYTLSSSPDCPTYESAYFGNDPQQQTQRMADIAGFYRAFGVDATEGGYRPDELSVELEFMAFLCRKEAYAEEHLGPPRARQARKAQRLFLQHHLGRWGGVFGQKLAELAPLGHFYAAAGSTVAWWLAEDCETAGITPDEVDPHAVQPCPAPVSHGPEFAGNASFVPLEALGTR